MFGGEYGWGTVKTLLTQRPGRSSVLGGQLVALGVAMLVGVVRAVRAQRREHRRDRAGRGPGGALAERVAAGRGLRCRLAGAVHLGHRSAPCSASRCAASRCRSGSASSGCSASRTWSPRWPAIVLTALQPLRDVLPGVNAGSLVRGGDARPGDRPTARRHRVGDRAPRAGHPGLLRRGLRRGGHLDDTSTRRRVTPAAPPDS